jgi:hypothetical protein
MNDKLFLSSPCIRTYTGKLVNVFDPKPEMFCIEDIATALSKECRWGGHLEDHYSVAEHSILCQQVVSKHHKLSALMHDASEAYLRDISRPIKNKLSDYKEIEHNLMMVLADKFDFEYPMHEEVKATDDLLLQIEWDVLMLKKENTSGVDIQMYNYKEAKNIFLSVFKFLSN